MLVAAVLYFAVDVVVFLAIDGIEAHPIARAEQREAVLDRRPALPTTPDRHRRPAKELVAARRLVRIDAGDGAAVANGALGGPGAGRVVFRGHQTAARIQWHQRAEARPEAKGGYPVIA